MIFQSRLFLLVFLLLMTPAAAFGQVVFTDVSAEKFPGGLINGHYLWGDCDGDGDDDLLVNGKTIYLNSGAPDYVFAQVADTGELLAGAHNRAIWLDLDNDGDLDLFGIGHGDAERLFRNNGNCSFTDISDFDADGTPDLGDDSPSLTASTGDYDADGFLDVYVGNYELYCGGDPTICGDCRTDRLWHNLTNSTFEDVTVSTGIYDQEHALAGICNIANTPCDTDADCAPYPADSCNIGTCARGSNWVDYDNDGDIDIFVANYRLTQNLLWENNGDGSFTNVGEDRNVDGDEDNGAWGHVLGADWGDIDNDGDMDLITAALAHGIYYLGAGHDISELLINSGAPEFNFVDTRATSGMREFDPFTQPDWAETSPAWADYNNDGFLDLYVTHIYDSSEYTYSDLYLGNGDGTFLHKTADYPQLKLYKNYSGSWSDFDQDGDLDLVTYGAPTHDGTSTPHLFRNDGGNAGNWLHVRLRGAGSGASNRFAVGARVSVLHASVNQMREVQGGHGYHTAMNTATQSFGFGSGDPEPVQELTVRWTTGATDVFVDVAMQQRALIFENGVTIRRGNNPQNLPVHDAEAKFFPYTDVVSDAMVYYQVDDSRANEMLIVEKDVSDNPVLRFP